MPDRKRCSKCREVKRLSYDPAESDFYLQKRHNRAGYTVIKPAPECKVCAKKRVQRLRASKTLEQRSAEHKRWNANRDPEAVRLYFREYGRIRRFLNGAKPNGGWKKYRNQIEQDERVNRQPFNDWLAATPFSASELAQATGLNEAVFRRKGNTIMLTTVDLVFTHLGIPDQTYVLYPRDPIPAEAA